jgi:ABC-type glycerol-3-phosphate transport system substrate-binding protein
MMKPPTPWPPPSGAKVWGMPVSISADAMAYNLELFEAAGIKPPPQDPDDRAWTMDAFAELAMKLTKGTAQFGWGGSYTPGNEWLNGATYFGYGPVDLAGKKITIDTPGYRSAHQYWFDLFNRRHVAPVNNAELEALRSAPGQSAFLTGKVAMDRISNFPTKPDFRWGVAALPYTPNPAQPRSVAGRISVHGLYMDSDSKNKEQAWQVFRYWMRPDKNQDYVWSDGHVVSPLVKTGSELSLKRFQESVNVADAKAFLRSADRYVTDDEELEFGKFKVKVVHTPGHTPGSLCLLVANHLFTGDTLLAGGIGREMPETDLRRQMMSIGTKLLSLPPATAVYPGHGPVTSLEQELRTNPIFRPVRA